MNRNIVLIGMPGCGKTTIGALLSKRLNLQFIDVDEYIERLYEKTIVELFEQGEEYFRKVETDVIKKISSINNRVISTGGGVVKNPLNIQELKKNGIIVFIDRPIDNIASDVDVSNRPLLKDGKERLYQIFKERYNMYNSCCDFKIANKGTVEEVIKKIIDSINNS